MVFAIVILNAVKNLVVRMRPFVSLRVTVDGHSERSEESRCACETLRFAQGDTVGHSERSEESRRALETLRFAQGDGGRSF